MNGLDLFSGIGGLALALEPWVRTVAYCEIDDYARAILLSRMATGDLEAAPIWDDVRTLKAEHLPPIDIISGGFPCQDLSDASRGRGRGLDGERSGLWREMLRLVGECRPRHVFIENVDGAAWKRWVPVVRRDLHRLGYSSLPIRMRADQVGAPFRGSRIFLAATDREGKSAEPLDAEMARVSTASGSSGDWRKPPAAALGMADGIPYRMERLRACGNAVVPSQARAAFGEFMNRHHTHAACEGDKE